MSYSRSQTADNAIPTLFEPADVGRELQITPGAVGGVRGLVPVARTVRGVRLYNPAHVEQVRQEREAARATTVAATGED